MDINEECSDDILRCPLCGSEEYLLSDSNTLICASCGCMVENVDEVVSYTIAHLNRHPQMLSAVNKFVH